MKLKIYLDVSGWETSPEHFFPFTSKQEKRNGITRLSYIIKVPDHLVDIENEDVIPPRQDNE